ncbi:MAG TPA: hypothetical protein VK116_11355, partial [Planctomycetota bacterium]|nr:hypothetical protein [Planctomycetota bacterium]
MTADGPRSVDAFSAALLRYRKCARLWPGDHPRVRETAAEVESTIRRFTQSGSPALVVRSREILARKEAGESERHLALLLRRALIEAVSIEPGVTEPELRTFARLLGKPSPDLPERTLAEEGSELHQISIESASLETREGSAEPDPVLEMLESREEIVERIALEHSLEPSVVRAALDAIATGRLREAVEAVERSLEPGAERKEHVVLVEALFRAARAELTPRDSNDPNTLIERTHDLVSILCDSPEAVREMIPFVRDEDAEASPAASDEKASDPPTPLELESVLTIEAAKAKLGTFFTLDSGAIDPNKTIVVAKKPKSAPRTSPASSSEPAPSTPSDRATSSPSPAEESFSEASVATTVESFEERRDDATAHDDGIAPNDEIPRDANDGDDEIAKLDDEIEPVEEAAREAEIEPDEEANVGNRNSEPAAREPRLHETTYGRKRSRNVEDTATLGLEAPSHASIAASVGEDDRPTVIHTLLDLAHRKREPTLENHVSVRRAHALLIPLIKEVARASPESPAAAARVLELCTAYAASTETPPLGIDVLAPLMAFLEEMTVPRILMRWLETVVFPGRKAGFLRTLLERLTTRSSIRPLDLLSTFARSENDALSELARERVILSSSDPEALDAWLGTAPEL